MLCVCVHHVLVRKKKSLCNRVTPLVVEGLQGKKDGVVVMLVAAVISLRERDAGECAREKPGKTHPSAVDSVRL